MGTLYDIIDFSEILSADTNCPRYRIDGYTHSPLRSRYRETVNGGCAGLYRLHYCGWHHRVSTLPNHSSAKLTKTTIEIVSAPLV